MRKIRIALDLDGTLYDALPQILDVDNQILKSLGLPGLTEIQYKAIFQSKDWDKLYSDLGINEGRGYSKEQRQEAIKSAEEMFFLNKDGEFQSPPLIPGAKHILHRFMDLFGEDNLTIITNEQLKRVKKRFMADDLKEFLSIVRKPSRQGKADEIYQEAIEKPEIPFVYIGDLVCDGEDCLEARIRQRQEGVKPNIYFYGITHRYAMNLPENIMAFVNKYYVSNPGGFARALTGVYDISRIFGDFKIYPY